MLNNNNQHITTQLNRHIGLGLLHEWKCRTTSGREHKRHWFQVNKHARCVHHYTVPRCQGDAAIHRYFGQETLVTVAAKPWQLHVLVLLQMWTFCGGKEKIFKTFKILFTTDKNCKWRLRDVTQCGVRQYYSKSNIRLEFWCCIIKW